MLGVLGVLGGGGTFIFFFGGGVTGVGATGPFRERFCDGKVDLKLR